MSGARIWPSAATLELGIPLLVPFSEGGGGVTVKGGDLGTGSGAAMVMSEGQQSKIYCITHPEANSRTKEVSSAPFNVLTPSQNICPWHKSVSNKLQNCSLHGQGFDTSI